MNEESEFLVSSSNKTTKAPTQLEEKSTVNLQTLKSTIDEYLRVNPGDEVSVWNAIPASKKKKYYFGKFFKANFYNAVVYCKHRGMELASVGSAEEQQMLEKVVNNVGWPNEHIWISETRSENDGRFVWSSTGSAFNFTKWGKGEPQISHPKNCLAILKTAEGYRRYMDDCSSEYYFICECYNHIYCQNSCD